jgi:UDP-N-acetylmuramoyl-tripeptide--D-alanyl-D-alanine ligase
MGGDLAQAGLALADMPGLKGRGERHTVRVDGGEALLIDESYNANPSSMRATLKTLGAQKIAGRRIVVLGSMRELGSGSDGFHAELAEPIQAACVDFAILVGEEMRPLAKALGQKVNFEHVLDVASAIDPLREAARPGDAILVKGSNSIGLASLVEAMASGKS